MAGLPDLVVVCLAHHHLIALNVLQENEKFSLLFLCSAAVPQNAAVNVSLRAKSAEDKNVD